MSFSVKFKTTSQQVISVLGSILSLRVLKSEKDVWEAACIEEVLRLVFLRLIHVVGTFSPVIFQVQSIGKPVLTQAGVQQMHVLFGQCGNSVFVNNRIEVQNSYSY